jgi:hypothetical protein
MCAGSFLAFIERFHDFSGWLGTIAKEYLHTLTL